jgi:hypothetical protein
VSDYLPNMLWVQMFLAEQGYVLDESKLKQDNESAMKLEKNGRLSAGQKSRHIHIRYFWIKDRSEEHRIQIEHCPTVQMLADFFTKPLQGHLFRRFRDVILGHCHVDTLRNDFIFPSEERVGEERPDHNADATQYNNTTVQTTTGENTDVTTTNTNVTDENANDENARTREQGSQEQDTWIQVVDRRSKKKNKDKQIVSRNSLSQNNPVN